MFGWLPLCVQWYDNVKMISYCMLYLMAGAGVCWSCIILKTNCRSFERSDPFHQLCMSITRTCFLPSDFCVLILGTQRSPWKRKGRFVGVRIYIYIYIYIVTFFRRWSMILFLWFEQKNCIAVGNSTFHMNIPSQDLSDLYADGGWATMVSGREVHSWEPVYFRTWSGSITPTPWSLQDKASAEVSGVGPSQRWVRRPGLDDLGSEHSASQNESHVHRLLKLLILATIFPWKITTGIVLLSYCSFVL